MGKSCADVAVCTLSGHTSGNSGFGSASIAPIRASSSSSVYGILRRWRSSSSDRAPRRASAVVVIAGRVVEHRGADRLAELVAPLVGVAPRLVVSEPVVPRGDITAARLQEQDLGSRHATLDRRTQRPRILGIPLQDLPAHQRRMAGEPGDDRDRRPVLTVDPEHRDTVVDRPLAPHAVDGDARRATGPDPTRAGRRCRQAE